MIAPRMCSRDYKRLYSEPARENSQPACTETIGSCSRPGLKHYPSG